MRNQNIAEMFMKWMTIMTNLVMIVMMTRLTDSDGADREEVKDDEDKCSLIRQGMLPNFEAHLSSVATTQKGQMGNGQLG